MEDTAAAAVATPALEAPTIAQALRLTAANNPDVVAIRTVDDSFTLTWAQTLARVEAIARGLAELGVGVGDTVGLMMSNRPEFHLVDHAVTQLGATPFSIYTQYPAEQVSFLCQDAATKLVITEQAFAELVGAARAQAPSVEHVVCVDADLVPGTIPLAQLESTEFEFDVAAAAAAINPDDTLTLIYTSGTTGPPKGVQITHSNAMTGARGMTAILHLEPGSRVISWLPAAHIAERMGHHYIPTVFGCTITVCPDPKSIVGFLPQVRPTWFFAVPRVWEKLKAVLEAMQAAQPDEQRQPAQAAIANSIERVRLLQRREPVPPEVQSAWEQADAQMFSGLRNMLGLDEVQAVSVGAAPTAVDVLEFFHALGIEIRELWGMSETCGFGTTNRPDAVKLGTVGLPSPGCEVKLGPDGELLVRGGFVMAGYRNNPEKTRETIDPDGWLHTGDIAEIDDEGFVRIIDRKKELIINAAGKNMSPANIEATLKAGSPLIGQACVIGDRRPFNTALIVLDPDFGKAWAAQNGLGEKTFAELTREPAVLAAIDHGVQAANAQLARVEQIKRFVLVTDDWLPGGDELTPTMKLKRRPIAEKYEREIEEMYSG